MIKISYDFHIHSCLSPCGDEDMTPANIVGMATIKELDAIAVTDHNSCKNCHAVMSMAEQYGIMAIPGMELCTLEEVHVLCLFTTLQDAIDFDDYVSSKLIKVSNNEQIFGRQEIYNTRDECVGNEPYLLINATEISFDQLDELMKRYKGIYIPAHIDKSSNSLLSNLGFIPPDARFSCAEVKDIEQMPGLLKNNPYLKKCNIITNSDAHTLASINEPVNFLQVKKLSVEGVLEALLDRNKGESVLKYIENKMEKND